MQRGKKNVRRLSMPRRIPLPVEVCVEIKLATEFCTAVGLFRLKNWIWRRRGRSPSSFVFDDDSDSFVFTFSLQIGYNNTTYHFQFLFFGIGFCVFFWNASDNNNSRDLMAICWIPTLSWKFFNWLAGSGSASLERASQIKKARNSNRYEVFLRNSTISSKFNVYFT